MIDIRFTEQDDGRWFAYPLSVKGSAWIMANSDGSAVTVGVDDLADTVESMVAAGLEVWPAPVCHGPR